MSASKTKSHDRAPGIVQTSIALPAPLLNAVAVIAAEQERSRNQVMVMLLREKVAEYNAKKGVKPNASPATNP